MKELIPTMNEINKFSENLGGVSRGTHNIFIDEYISAERDVQAGILKSVTEDVQLLLYSKMR